jgi:hypothetical protein
MTVKNDVSAKAVAWAKHEVTFIGYFVCKVHVKPGVQERISGSFHLLVRGKVDRTIGYLVMVGAGERSQAACEYGGVNYGCIDCVGSKERMVRAEEVHIRQRIVLS